MLFVRAYPRETQEMVFDAHDREFAFLRSACTRGIHDNLKVAVDAIFVDRNILSRCREPAPPVTILTPDALRLTHAPVADCARYDTLRRPI